MSYKKIVAGVATFAIASAMVVPAAFAITSADAIDTYTTAANAPVDAKQKQAANAVLEQAKQVKDLEGKVKAAEDQVKQATRAYEQNEDKSKADELRLAKAKAEGSLTQHQNDLKKAQAKLDQMDQNYKDDFGKKDENKKPEGEKPAGENTAKPESNKAEYVIIFDGKEYKLDEAGLKDLGLDVAYVKDWTSEKKNAIESAENTLKTLDRFVKRTTEIKVGDMIYTVDQLADVLKTKLAELKKADIKTTNLNALQQLTKFMKEIENGVNAKMKTDPAALKKSGGEADKKAAAKATSAKGGKNLPKTADAAPVAPIAAVAGSAALIAAGLVASRKVNA